MRQAKIQRRPSGGSEDINSLIRSKIEDVFKSQLDGLYRIIKSTIRGQADQIKKLEKCLEVCGEKIFQKIANHVIKLESEVEQTDRLISALISDRNAQKIRNHFDDLMVSGNFSAASMWSIKKKLNLSCSK